ncbi:hypothetical protein JYP49_14330 [Nitratireductor aquimarinus]|uniref:hypothetical protein n=1 Tax=Nitratireductor TaxID=245876 RepID=UPI0019D377B3|nr:MULTISPECIES: hypothetical protein [Nitratireductor]MBN7777774.1 hypothetical protein [Nitratireductor pacificus]MBN7781768.1 hypothetical protein [Nitratireductor pacificus]MBN7790574.1 hypothetical protein [Nitratireductor aquimarinus]MBY6099984.1 hypothetical protein [Nitratireductor aquimarinus]MCA1260448.1 hypothetical protein [Nitratireductor aquimarinus]
MLTVCTLLWDANRQSRDFSRMYDEEWVHKLYRGFCRNLTVPFRFVCFTDRPRIFDPGIEQDAILARCPDYGACIEAYRTEGPMILAGLDTVAVGNIDHLAAWCETAKVQALPRDPYRPHIACNGVALVPKGWTRIAKEHRGENDMEWVRKFPHVFIDDLFPGQVVSFKGHVKKRGLARARIVYFHGQEKPHQLPGVDWIKEHWV